MTANQKCSMYSFFSIFVSFHRARIVSRLCSELGLRVLRPSSSSNSNWTWSWNTCWPKRVSAFPPPSWWWKWCDCTPPSGRPTFSSILPQYMMSLRRTWELLRILGWHGCLECLIGNEIFTKEKLIKAETLLCGWRKLSRGQGYFFELCNHLSC